MPQVLEGYLEAWLTHRELQNGSKRFEKKNIFIEASTKSVLHVKLQENSLAPKENPRLGQQKRLQANFHKVEPKLKAKHNWHDYVI